MQTQQVTDQQIREHLGHGRGNRIVRIKRTGEIHYYGSTDPVDRSHDWWHYGGTRDEVAAEIEDVINRPTDVPGAP